MVPCSSEGASNLYPAIRGHGYIFTASVEQDQTAHTFHQVMIPTRTPLSHPGGALTN